jgi:DNA transposition AAA+ family ATPase
MNRVLHQARAGDVLQPRGADRSATLPSEQPEPAGRRGKDHKTYETHTVRKIAAVCEYCASHAAIGVVTGEFGVGKSQAVRIWRSDRGREVDCLVFELTEFTAGSKTDFIRNLAELLGLETPPGSQMGARMFEAVCDRLREAPALIVVDQAEMARPRIFQCLRQIWDRTHEDGVGVVILAAPVLMTRMIRTRSDDLGALSSRVGIWEQLPGLALEEMAAILKQEGIGELDDDAFRFWWQSVNGSIRRLMWSVALLKERHHGKITKKTLQGVAASLWGMQVRIDAT